MEKTTIIKNVKADANTVIQMTDSARLKLKPSCSFISWMLYVCCLPLWIVIQLIPAAKTENCLPMSSSTLVIVSLVIFTGFQQLLGYVAKGMFKPLWNFLGENHQEKIVHLMGDFIIRSSQFGLFCWFITSQEQSLTKATVKIDMESCNQQAASCITVLHVFFTMMVWELFMMKKMSKGLVAHHCFSTFGILTLTERSLQTYTSGQYYISAVACLFLGAVIGSVEDPGYIYYHLYPNSTTVQFASYLWILFWRIINVTVLFLVLPGYIIWANFDKMSAITFWMIFFIYSVINVSELFIFRILVAICHEKYLVWKYTLDSDKL